MFFCFLYMRNKEIKSVYYITLLFSVLIIACSDQITGDLFKGKTPHERYSERLENAGLNGSILYERWLAASVQSLQQPIEISVPYQEKAYFGADIPNAAGYLFEARDGEQLQIEISPQSLDSVQLFIDLFARATDTTQNHMHLASVEADSTFLSYTVRRNGEYILRIQPELLSDVSFDLRITAEPSLSNPVAENAKQHIGSFFGVDRDGGRRSHEGIDIFADRLTPAVAATDGVIRRVGTNNLGGKVVFLRAQDRPISLYYAHLDSQIVSTGQTVKTGDTVGLIGNTGNARTTPPHLHFGIYTSNGAVDPLPFVRPGKSTPSAITSDIGRIGDTLRISTSNHDVAILTPLIIEAAALNGYRATLPDQSKVFVSENQVTNTSQPLRTLTLRKEKLVYRSPHLLAAIVNRYPAGEQVQILAEIDDYYLIENNFMKGWIEND